MSGTPLPESTTRDAVVITPAAPPEGYESETLSEVPTLWGLAVLRVRSHVETFHVGGVGPVPTRVYTVAVRTPRTVRERRGEAGFVEVFGHFLLTGPDGLGYTPANAAEVHVAVGLRIEAAADRRTRELAENRPPVPSRRVPRPQMPSAPGKEEPGDGGPALRPVPPAEGERPFVVVRPSRPAPAHNRAA